MNICVFGRYKVHFVNKYDYIADYEFGEPSYDTQSEEWTEEMDGGKLIDLLAKVMRHSDMVDVSSSDKNFHTSLFNPMNSCGSEIQIEYEEVKGESISDIFDEEFTPYPGYTEHEPIPQEIKLINQENFNLPEE